MADTENLDKYVIELKKYINDNPNLNENDIVMYVYVDLGAKFIFDVDFFYGKNKTRKQIYGFGSTIHEINRIMERKIITCNSVSHALKYILNAVNINVEVDICDEASEFKHVYNIIYPKDDGLPYKIDLQQDMPNIHYHGKTLEFGLSLGGSNRYVISLEEQRKIHEKIGYISDNNPYTDEYTNLLKKQIEDLDNFYDKIDFVLKNIDPVIQTSDGIHERRKRHEKIINDIFLFQKHYTDIKPIILFHDDENDIRKYYNGFFIFNGNNSIIYLYSTTDNYYNSYTLDEFAKKAVLENICYNQNIKAIKKAIEKEKQNKK